jgi:hypothetical protein
MGRIKWSSAEKMLQLVHPASPEKALSLLLCSIMRELVINFLIEIALVHGFELPGRVETPQV